MLFVFFPKEFEKSKFLLELAQEKSPPHHVKVSVNETLDFEIVFYHDTDHKTLVFAWKVVDASDVDFLFRVDNLVRAIKSKGWDKGFKFLLFGTCGSFGANVKVGNCYKITRALKYDRGEITANGRFQSKKGKVLECVVHGFEQKEYEKRSVFSGNALCNMEKGEATKMFKKICGQASTLGLVEMETFDFFKLIQDQHKLELIGALRVVSDIINGNNEKFCRLTCPFKLGKKEFLKILREVPVSKFEAGIAVFGTPGNWELVTMIASENPTSLQSYMLKGPGKDLNFDKCDLERFNSTEIQRDFNLKAKEKIMSHLERLKLKGLTRTGTNITLLHGDEQDSGCSIKFKKNGKRKMYEIEVGSSYALTNKKFKKELNNALPDVFKLSEESKKSKLDKQLKKKNLNIQIIKEWLTENKVPIEQLKDLEEEGSKLSETH